MALSPSDLWHRIRALLRRGSVETELDDELRFHLERQMETLMRAGLSPEEASRQARLSFGGLEQVKEACRQARGISLLDDAFRDLRHALRGLRRRPGFTAVVVLSLGLGLGANTAIFSLMDAVMWKALPVAAPEGLFLLARTGTTDTSHEFSYQELQRLREHRRPFPALAAYSSIPLNVSVDGNPEPTTAGQLVSGNIFSVLGVKAHRGRVLSDSDDRTPDAHPVAMLSHRYWKRRFGEDPAIVGGTITLSGKPFTVVGVTPPGFSGLEVGEAPDIFAPLMMQPTLMPASENLLGNAILYKTWLRVFGRLAEGATAQQAAASLQAAVEPDAGEITKSSLARAETPKLIVLPAATGISGLRAEFSRPLWVLMAVVGLVLLLACTNTATLMLARAAGRRHEMTLRAALGAGRGRLMRQALVESVLLAFMGGAAGLLLAQFGTQLLVTLMSAGRTPIHLDLSPDARVLAFTAAASMLSGVSFGLAPALRSTALHRTMAARAPTRLPLGRVLALSQVALSFVLLVGAGLFLLSLQNLNDQDGGFQREQVLTVRVEPWGSDQRNIPGTTARLDRIYRDLLSRVQALPGIRSASLARSSPTNPVDLTAIIQLPSGEAGRIPTLMVYPHYFATLGIPLVAGRDLQASDLHETSPLVGIVNQSFARQLFPGQNPLGKHIVIRAGGSGRVRREIIGVVENSRYDALRGETPPIVYQPFLQTSTGRGQMVLHVRTDRDAGLEASIIQKEVQKVDRNLPLFPVRSLAEEVDAILVRERLIATLSSVFGALALLLACVGLYGLFAFSLLQRTPEIGIRLALGAHRATVMWMIVREALSLIALGTAVGVAAALAAGQLAQGPISSFLFGLKVTDPATFAGAAAVLATAVLMAVSLPAWRACLADPMTALRRD